MKGYLVTPEEIKELPKYIGIVADVHYARKDAISYIISNLSSKSVVVLPSGGGLEDSIRNQTLLRGNLFVKDFEVSESDLRHMTQKTANKVSDKLFLSFLKEVKGHVFIFPHRYRTRGKGGDNISYSRRVQDLIISAYTMNVKHTVVYPEDIA